MNCDYIIIGGGVYGCGMAWELSDAGADVVLLEQDRIAAGSSGGSGARGIRSDFRDIRELPMIRRAQQLWPTIDDRLGAITGYQRTGGLRLVEKEYVGGVGGRASLEAHAWMQNQAGIPTSVLDRDAVLELEPGLSELITHALYVPEDGVAPHAQTTRALATAAERLGAVIREHSPVISLTWSGRRVSSVHTADTSFTPRRSVIVATNAGTRALLGDRDPVPGWAVIPQATFVRPVQPPTLTHLVNHESRPLSLKAGPDGTVQISGGLRGLWDPVRQIARVDESVVGAALADAAAVYPELEGAAVETSEAGGPESCSPDGIPVVDRLSGSDNVYVATHWTGHGFALFPAVIEALRGWLIEGSKPAILNPFSVTRFAPDLTREPALEAV